MKTVFDKETRDELINRINTLDENSKAQWGKMTVYRMLKHRTLFEEIALGKKKYKRMVLGRLFGKIALKSNLKGGDLKKNMRTLPSVRVKETENGDVIAQRDQWIELIKEYAQFSNDNVEHPFFGKMTKEQNGRFAYKHTDHHLRQFNR